MSKKHSMNMNDERAPQGSFPEGRNECMVSNCEEQTSKAGNPMFVVTLVLLDDTSVTTDVYLVAVPKKRYFLKRLLDVCGISAAKDGVYDFFTSDLLGKEIIALVKIEHEKWIDREGNERVTPKGKVYGFDKILANSADSSDPEPDEVIGGHDGDEELMPF